MRAHPHKMSKLYFKLIISLFLGTLSSSAPTVEEYLSSRNLLLQEENNVRLGSHLRFNSAAEIKVNNILMNFKTREYDEGLDSNGDHYTTTKHFFLAKPFIERSDVFKIIRLLPKGAGLHLHDMTGQSADFVVKNLTYMDNLYYCFDGNSNLTFHFYESRPKEECFENTSWTLVSELRNSNASTEKIDTWFAQSFSLYTSQPALDYPSIKEVWKAFEDKITTIEGVGNYLPALKKLFRQTLQEFYEDNVMYIEQRGVLTGAYHLNQTLLSPLEILAAYQTVVDEFKRDHPDFWGVKYIYAPQRFSEPTIVSKMINLAVEMKAKFPDFVAGFDLVGQEDTGTPLIDYISQLLDAASKNVRFFFHAGETARHGTKIDENLVDAILLNTTRIGHAYALASHPALADIVQERRIAVESCPISNQVLKLVNDLRNHPVIPLMKAGFPLVIASDDPGMWGAKGLSHDWYVAFMAMAGKRADLRFLKKLALNSIEYSAMSDQEKTVSYAKWTISWSNFLNKVIELYDQL